MFYRQSAKYGAALGAALLSGAARGDVPSPYAAQMGYALHLVEGARYGEACDAAQALVDTAPNAAPSYEVRGTLALYVGNIARARDDFRVAASLASPNRRWNMGWGCAPCLAGTGTRLRCILRLRAAVRG